MGREEQVRALLAQLNHWESNYGTAFRGDPTLKDKGEANARIEDLKSKLAQLGARFHWNGKEYVLDSIIETKKQ
jgi:hypothetical protein